MSTKRFTIMLDLTPPQAIAVEDFLHTWNQLSNLGASRWTAFYADGDGDFHPKATLNGEVPKATPLLKGRDDRWQKIELGGPMYTGNDECYCIDYDVISWRMR